MDTNGKPLLARVCHMQGGVVVVDICSVWLIKDTLPQTRSCCLACNFTHTSLTYSHLVSANPPPVCAPCNVHSVPDTSC